MVNQMIKYSIISAIFIAFITSCNSQVQNETIQNQGGVNFEEAMIQSHKLFVEKSTKAINQYVNQSDYEFITTGTGLRYAIISTGVGVRPVKGNEVKIEYIIEFLDGEKVLNYEKPKTISFYIEQSSVESGLHEALQLMKLGEKASFIFPPHLAFGMSGDRQGIPPQSTLLYTIELLAIR